MDHLCEEGFVPPLHCTPVQYNLISFHTPPYLLFEAPAILQLSMRVWRRTGLCNVSQLRWVLLGVSMKPALCPLQSQSLSHWKGAEWELGGGMDEINIL